MDVAATTAPVAQARYPTFAEALRFWMKLGWISFGGPAGQIAIMHTEIVERRRWISERRFLHALNYCMILPGPEAQQLAIYIGWLLHRTAGGIAAGAFFVIPSIFILWTLSFIYAAYGNVPWIAAAFYGLKPAVLAIVLAAVLRIGRKALKNELMWIIAGLAFMAIYFFKIPFPVIVFTAGVVGWLGGKWLPGKFVGVDGGGHGPKSATTDAAETALAPAIISDDAGGAPHTRPQLPRALRVAAIWLLLWAAPLIALALWLGGGHTLVKEGIFFSKAATVTFGGAYAVLPYVSQQAVEHYHWLAPGQMLDGLGLAETTPGPLIMVLQFVGFMGGWNFPDGLPPLLAATLGALITTWTTFTPCFLWVLVGAPYMERLRDNRRLAAALSTITAAVVGVILNLAVWFGGHVLFPAGFSALPDGFCIALCLAAFVAMQRFQWELIPVVLASGALGIVWKMALGF